MALEVQEIDKEDDFMAVIVNDDMIESLNPSDFKNYSLNLLIKNQINSGVAAARNKAISLSAGEVILFLDQDCVPQSDWLRKMIAFFKDHPDMDAVGGYIEPFSGRGLINDYFNYNNTLGKPIIDRLTGEIVCLITGNAGFRLSALKKIRGFNENAFNKSSHGGEDVDLTYRLKKAGFKIGCESEAVVFHSYPNNLRAVFYKYANYGRGMRLFCLARNINPTEIRQPKLSWFSALAYFFNILPKAVRNFYSYGKLKRTKAILFVFLDIIKYLGHGYGYFYANYKSKFIPTE